MVNFRDRVSLRQVLVRIAGVFHDAEVRLENRVAVFEVGGKAKLISQRRASGCNVRTERDVDLVENIVVEVVLVWPNARFLVRVHTQRQHQRLLIRMLVHERIDIGRVGGRIECDQRRVHVTRSARRCGEQGSGHGEQHQSRDCSFQTFR